MNIQGVGGLSLGQWADICRAWNRANSKQPAIAPPSEDEFDAAVIAARRAG